jgi:glycine oxidase
MNSKVTIYGSGVMGLCVATVLQDRGFSVDILDPQLGPGPESCSWWAGGMLAPDCESETSEQLIVDYGRLSADWWQSRGVPVINNGSLVVALNRDKSELKRFASRTQNHRMVDKQALCDMEPHIGERFDRALFMHRESHLDPRQALAQLKQSLEVKGAKFKRTKTKDTPSPIIDCSGLAANEVLPDLRGVKGEMVVLQSSDIDISRPVRLLHPRFPLYIVPRGEGIYMVGATQIESEDRETASLRSVVELLNAAYALHPAFAEAKVLEIGVGARPAFPDNLPRIVKIDETLHVNGLFRHGFLLAPALACKTVDYFLEQRKPEVWFDYNDER